MKTTPHDPLDDLMAAALHGELTPAERAQFESRLNNDPAARAAFQEAQAMHDLLEKTHRDAQPDAAFEQRMVSGVRRKLQQEQHRETAWESVLVIWRGLTGLGRRHRTWEYVGVCGALALLVAFAFSASSGVMMHGVRTNSIFATITSQLAVAGEAPSAQKIDRLVAENQVAKAEKEDFAKTYLPPASPKGIYAGNSVDQNAPSGGISPERAAKIAQTEEQHWHRTRANILNSNLDQQNSVDELAEQQEKAKVAADIAAAVKAQNPASRNGANGAPVAGQSVMQPTFAAAEPDAASPILPPSSAPAAPVAKPPPVDNDATTPAPIDNRKLIRNANLDLEVKSYQDTVDKITALTKAAGGYVDASNSQKGGNGKLQGTVVAKVLPQNLDAFLLKLRDLGTVQNQSVSTDDVTKDYVDTQARLVNSQKMEAQLQELLKRENGKVADLLQVERELERVRGDIEQMQGQLKLYDFQVQYATVTMQIAEKDLKQTAAYLLKEQDDFSLYATDVEQTFQKSRAAADDFKAQVLVATLNHNSGSDVSALLVVSVPPDQIEPFLAQVRGLGRVANFTRDTKRVAKDGGDSSQPADETMTEKDKIMVNVSIHSDDETRKQVAMTVVAKAVDAALEDAKTAALEQPGVEILSSSLNKAPEGQSTASLSVRVPGKDYAALMEAFRALGRVATLSIQRNDDSGPGASGDDVPVIVALSLTDDDQPMQQTNLSVIGSDVDAESRGSEVVEFRAKPGWDGAGGDDVPHANGEVRVVPGKREEARAGGVPERAAHRPSRRDAGG
jgi:hypothetical protein